MEDRKPPPPADCTPIFFLVCLQRACVLALCPVCLPALLFVLASFENNQNGGESEGLMRLACLQANLFQTAPVDGSV